MARLYWKHKLVGVEVNIYPALGNKVHFMVHHPSYRQDDAAYMCIAHEGNLYAVRFIIHEFTKGAVLCQTVIVTDEVWAKPILLQELLLK